MPRKTTTKRSTRTSAQSSRARTGYSTYRSKPRYRRQYNTQSKPKVMKASEAVSTNSSSSGGWLADGLGTIGSMLLPGIGGPIGRGVGSLIKTVTGFGDYEIKQNSLVHEAGAPPSFANANQGKETIIKHREYLADIVSSATPGAFLLQNFFINPGQAASFPWLSGIASNFEHYQVRGIIFEFRSLSADALNSTNTALGQVLLATNYNAASPNFLNKYEMENYEYGQSVKPSCSIMHPIECARSNSVITDLYIRPSSVPEGEDQRLYDFGNFQIATFGMQGASVNVGELWVTYEIALYKPKLYSALGNNIQIWQLSSSTGVALEAPFGTSQNLNLTNTMNMTYTTPQGAGNVVTVTFPNSVRYGQYYFKYTYAGTTTGVLGGVTMLAVSNCTIGSSIMTPDVGTTAASFSRSGIITVSGVSPSFSVDLNSTVPGGTTMMSIIVMQVPDSFTG